MTGATYTLVRHMRSRSRSSGGSMSSLLPSEELSNSSRSLPRRLRCRSFAGLLGCLGLVLLAGSVALPRSTQRGLVQHSSHSVEVSTATAVAADVAIASLPLEEAVSTLDPVRAASLSIDKLYARQSETLDQAVARYSLRNSRPPPQNFDKWFRFAQDNKCLIDDYDQIQRDFDPFYQLARTDPRYFQKMIELGRNEMLEDSNGMVAIKIENGRIQMPNYTGSVFDVEWLTTLSKFGYVVPDTEFLINGRDEPRVVFNSREPKTRKEATTLKDKSPFHVAPVPTSEFFRHRSGCSTLNNRNGLTVDALEDVAFIRSSSTSDFTTDLWPMLSMTKISPCFSDILFPGQYYYDSSWWAGKFDHPNDVAWNDKKPQLYWRGSSNGGHIIHDNYHKFSRFRLIKISQSHPDLIDAKITAFYDSHSIIEEYDIGGERSPREEVYQYKYLLDVDGNTFSGRYLGLLRSGSLIFKATAFEEYFNDWLRPYQHYIPVKIDLSDLVEKVEWAIAHEDEARRIQETGMQFAQRVLTDAQNDCYFAAVLLEWARLQNYAEEAGASGQQSWEA
ncbi:glycosyl transferase family 90-domain-containing protein [Mycena pura]|uniref:Glycosyl transferase family 90-domain-containing protein n=1 Tax=Mycena pura TaxID=153505 RepID=A0AAD6ULM4_9AGAR|nr:glycosyl transferase family 90-domain-containing protein [Mycena pura]